MFRLLINTNGIVGISLFFLGNKYAKAIVIIVEF